MLERGGAVSRATSAQPPRQRRSHVEKHYGNHRQWKCRLNRLFQTRDPICSWYSPCGVSASGCGLEVRVASAQTNGGSTPTRGFEPGTRAPPARRRWPRTTEASRRKTHSFGRFSRRFRAQTRLHSLIGQNRGKRFVTRASRVISVRSTGLAESCLTSQIGRDGVYSGSYERIMKVDNFPPIYI